MIPQNMCGDGQAMALSSAKLLSPLLESLPTEFSSAQRDQLLRTWEHRWRRNYARRLWLGRCLQRLILRPRLAHCAFVALAGFPGLTRRLIRWTREA